MILSFISHLNRNDIIHLFRVSAPIPKKISQILPKFQNVAQSSHYLVKFGLPGGGLRKTLRSKGVDYRFHTHDIGLLCNSAVLPGSTFATEVVQGEFQGVTETIPHTRNFTRIKLEFYVDNEYRTLKFLEHWMEYITGASSADSAAGGYNFKLNYPESYRSQTTKIVKFEKNYRQNMEWNFVGLYPIALDSTRVQYQSSQVLKASCAFAFERYVCGRADSFSQAKGVAKNTTGPYAEDAAAHKQKILMLNPSTPPNDQRVDELKKNSSVNKKDQGIETASYWNDPLSSFTVSEGFFTAK